MEARQELLKSKVRFETMKEYLLEEDDGQEGSKSIFSSVSQPKKVESLNDSSSHQYGVEVQSSHNVSNVNVEVKSSHTVSQDKVEFKYL
jgi:hypothetical protein